LIRGDRGSPMNKFLGIEQKMIRTFMS